MAGPIAGVWLRSPLNRAEREDITRLVAALGSQHLDAEFEHFVIITTTAPIGGQYAGPGRPFNIHLTNDTEPRESHAIEEGFGFKPAAQLWFSADANGEEDHQV